MRSAGSVLDLADVRTVLAAAGPPARVLCERSRSAEMVVTSRLEEDFSRLVTPQEKDHPEVTVLRQVMFGPPRTALLAAAAEAQMLVVGSRGLGGLDGMSLGSVAATLLHHSPCPVAVVHPPVR
jgi:nucleotide-binding universal stress UspA family protein